MNRIAMIAAMEREVTPFLRGWRKDTLRAGRREFVAFQHDAVLMVISGIGCKNAQLAAQTAIERFQPALLMSVGLAGALLRSLRVGNVFTPSVVVDAADGTEFRCSADKDRVSGGVLVSAQEVAGAQAKQELVRRFHALVVDMEAAGVARAAQQRNIDFRCVKVISDEADFAMPPMGRFIDANGHVQSAKFAAWAALRPWQWAKVVALARNSSRATAALCQCLEKELSARPQAGDVVTLNRAGVLEAKH